MVGGLFYKKSWNSCIRIEFQLYHINFSFYGKYADQPR